MNAHRVSTNFLCFVTVTKKSVSKWSFEPEFTAGTQIVSIQSHSTSNPYKSELLQLWSSSPTIQALLSCSEFHTFQWVSTKQLPGNSICSLLNQLSKPVPTMLNARKPLHQATKKTLPSTETMLPASFFFVMVSLPVTYNLTLSKSLNLASRRICSRILPGTDVRLPGL